MAQSFEVQEGLRKLLAPYPSPEEFREALGDVSKRSREHVVRLWLTEGTPFAFHNCPALYEEMRRWLGIRLEVCPKEITVVGSARIGFSLVKGQDFGRPFDKNSDLDLQLYTANYLEYLPRLSSAGSMILLMELCAQGMIGSGISGSRIWSLVKKTCHWAFLM